MRLAAILLLLAWPAQAADPQHAAACAMGGGCVEVPKLYLDQLRDLNERALREAERLQHELNRLRHTKGCMT